VHLGEADDLAHLSLGEVFFEARSHDLALAVRQDGRQAIDRRPLLGVHEAFVDDPDTSFGFEDRLDRQAARCSPRLALFRTSWVTVAVEHPSRALAS
jgi:hypothetical protein